MSAGFRLTGRDSRADEIAQGLRDEGGALTFPLDIIDYAQGHQDFREGNPPPKFSSPSYDLGRNRARERAEDDAEFKAWMAAEERRRDAVMRDILKDRPDLLADYEAKMAEIRGAAKAPSQAQHPSMP